MARIIFKTSYSDTRQPQTTSKSVVESMKYIGTRIGVELNYQQQATPLQINSIESLLDSFNENEKEVIMGKRVYKLYAKDQTEKAAIQLTKFLSKLSSEKENYTNDSTGYLRYIGRRKGVELNTTDTSDKHNHGLFNQQGAVDYDEYFETLKNYQGVVYNHIIALKKSDAELCGLDSRSGWEQLLDTKTIRMLAEQMQTTYDDLKWVGAFHNHENPHIHMICWSEKNDLKITRANIEKIKSHLVGKIYQAERKPIYEMKDKARDEFRSSVLTDLKYLIKNKANDLSIDDKEILDELEKLSKMINPNSKLKFKHLQNKNHQPKLEQINKVMSLILSNDKYKGIIESFLSAKVELASYYKDDKFVDEIDSGLGELRERIGNVILQSASQMKIKDFNSEKLKFHLDFIESDIKTSIIQYEPSLFKDSVEEKIFLEKKCYDFMKLNKVLGKSDLEIVANVNSLFSRSNIQLEQSTVEKLFKRLEQEVQLNDEYGNQLTLSEKEYNSLATTLDLQPITQNYIPRNEVVGWTLNKMSFELDRYIKEQDYTNKREKSTLKKIKFGKKGKKRNTGGLYGERYQNDLTL